MLSYVSSFLLVPTSFEELVVLSTCYPIIYSVSAHRPVKYPDIRLQHLQPTCRSLFTNLVLEDLELDWNLAGHYSCTSFY